MSRFRNPAGAEEVRFRSVHAVGALAVSPPKGPIVRRRLSAESARALEMLGHAIEYLADEYAVDPSDKGPLGNADPRVQAIQTLKALNRAVYFSGAEVQPVWQRLRRWWMREPAGRVESPNRP